MNIQGLHFVGIAKVKAMTNGDLVSDFKVFALGGGEWSIEAVDADGSLLKEFVGLNGTRNEEEATDLWAEAAEWSKQEARPAYSYKEFKAPDGTLGSISFFRNEVLRGRLHGCVVSF